MFDFLKNKPTNDIKGLRNVLVQFIKEQLQKWEGGEGNNITGLILYIACLENEKHLYEGALFYQEPNRFKENEIQKIADDFAIQLPSNWTMDFVFTNEYPKESIRAKEIDVALVIATPKKQPTNNYHTAFIKILSGETEHSEYKLIPSKNKINIGREKNVQVAEGFYRENTIAFVGNGNASNRSVSRQHAHIAWDVQKGAFYLFADEGGIPPYNKMKVKTENGSVVRLQSEEIGHRLQNGDQIILGDSAVLEFLAEVVGN